MRLRTKDRENAVPYSAGCCKTLARSVGVGDVSNEKALPMFLGALFVSRLIVKSYAIGMTGFEPATP